MGVERVECRGKSGGRALLGLQGIAEWPSGGHHGMEEEAGGPYNQTRKSLTSQARSPRGLGSSDLTFWVQEITTSKPLTDLHWPSFWPTHTTENELGGLEKVVCGVGTLQKKR